MADNTIRIRILGVDLASGTLKQVTAQLKKTGTAMRGIGIGMSAAITAPVVGFGISALKTAGEFQAGMNRVGVATKATATEMSALSGLARQLGASTIYSASEAADGMTLLAKAGFSTQQVMSAMPGIMNLAAASGIGVAEAAAIAEDAVGGFNYKAEEMASVNDMLVEATRSSEATMQGLGASLRSIAPLASSMGLKLSEVAAATALLANEGMDGTAAASAMRLAFSKLLDPSTEAIEVFSRLKIRKEDLIDSKGNVKNLTAVLKQLESSGATTADVMQLFGMRAGPGVAALMKGGSGALENYTKRLEDAAGKGGAASVADETTKGLNGSLAKLKSSFQELQIAVANSGLLDFATRMVQGLGKFIDKLSQANPALLKMVVVLAAVAAALGPMIAIFGQFLIWAGPVMAFFASHAAIGAFGAKLLTVLGPVGLIIAAFMIWANVIQMLIDSWDTWKDSFSSFGMFIKTMKFFLLDGLLTPLWDVVKGIGAAFKGLLQMVLPPWMEKLLGIGATPAAGTTPAGALAAGAAAGTTQTNNAKVEVKVSGPAGTRAAITEGTNTALQTDIGLLPVGG